MKTQRYGLALLVAALLAAVVTHVSAHKPATVSAVEHGSVRDAEDVLPMTCVQAWVESDRSYSKMLDVVRMLARVSLANRDLTFPNAREAGLDAGRGIAEDCKADPNALLYAVVDKHVRRVASAIESPSAP